MSVVFALNSVVLLSGQPPVIPIITIADITRDDIVDTTLKPVRRIAAVKSISLGYARNYTPMPDSIAAIVRENSPDIAEKLSQEFSVKEQNTPALINDIDAVSISVDTNIVNEADAITEAQRRLAMSSVERAVYSMDCFSAPFSFELGEIKTIDHPDYFAGGRPAVLTRIVDMYDEDQVSLEVEV
jgi:hypothetical protein